MPAWAELTTRVCSLNESPSEKEGKLEGPCAGDEPCAPLNESPSEKEGKCEAQVRSTALGSLPQ